jgi:hypothetical protein
MMGCANAQVRLDPFCIEQMLASSELYECTFHRNGHRAGERSFAAAFRRSAGHYNPTLRITGMRLQMPKNALDKVTIEVVCTDCGTGQFKPIGYFRDHAHLTCDCCGSEIRMENEQFRASIAEFAQTMARLKRVS